MSCSKRIVFLGLLLLATALPFTARAELVTAEEARTVGENWLARAVQYDGGWAGSDRPVIESVVPVQAGDRLLGWAFNVRPAGFVVVPVLKELGPVAAFSETGRVSPAIDPDEADLLRDRLADRVQRFEDSYGSLDAVGRSDRSVSRDYRAAWRSALRGEFPAPDKNGLNRQVGPLLTTHWDQHSPYNDDCPDVDGVQVKAGCVAIAAAQIMNYHEWPPYGYGSDCYNWTYGELCADFTDPYDWANMPDECTGGCDPAQSAAVAELVYEVGVALHMNYGVGASGASCGNVPVQLHEHFRYADGYQTYVRGDHTAAEWIDIVKEEVDNGRPALYSVANPGGAHAIVCDGWKYIGPVFWYHMNYGVGEYHDIWFELDTLHYSVPADDRIYTGITPEDVTIIAADGSGDHPTIQAAIDAAANGDLIRLMPGTYTGDGNRDVTTLGKSLTIESYGVDPAGVIIDCEGSKADQHRGFLFNSDEGSDTVIRGLTVTGGFKATKGGGIVCMNSSSPTLEWCVLVGNTAGMGGGLYIDGAAPTLRNCTIHRNDGGGIFGMRAAPQIHNTIISENKGAAFGCGRLNLPYLEYCNLWGNTGGDWTGCIEPLYGSNGNFSSDVRYCDTFSLELTLNSMSPCLPQNNIWGELIGAYEEGCSVYEVFPDGSGYYPTIQSAIDAAAESATVQLAAGTYTGDGNRDLNFGGKHLTVRSAESGVGGVATIDCQGSAADPHRAFIFGSGDSGSVATLTIVNGWTSGSGGAILATDGASPGVIWCRFEGNHAGTGGAIATEGDCQGIFFGNVFTDNTAEFGGGFACDGGSPKIWFSTFYDNEAVGHGGCVYAANSTLRMENSIFSWSRWSVGVHAVNSTLTFAMNDVYGNAAGDYVGCLTDFLGVAGNISEDPLFCDRFAGDLTLHEDSPCVSPAGHILMGAEVIGCTSQLLKDEDELPGVAIRFGLEPNHPNPFNPSTTFTFSLPRSGRAQLAVFDLRGRLVKVIEDGERPAGVYRATWRGVDGSGRQAASGVYFARLQFGEEVQTRKIILAK